jgi:cytochrome P450
MVDSGVPDLLLTRNVLPFVSYARMREEPVRWDKSMNGWVVSSYDLCKKVLRGDNTTFRHIDQDNREVVTLVTGAPRHMSFMTGDEHRRLHQWWLRLFSPGRMTEIHETVVKPIVAATVDRFVNTGAADLYPDLAARIPPRVIAAVLGLPWEDDEWIARMLELLNRVGAFFNRPPTEENIEADAIPASDELTAMLLPVIEERRSGDGDDIISTAWRDGPEILSDWDETDVMGMVRTMFLGGTDTTARGIANAMFLVLSRPDVATQVREDPSLEPAFVEESLRLFPPAHFRVRLANEDVEVGGVTIHKDEKVLPLLGSANRDPGKYPEPDEFAMDRRALRDHVAFNYGSRTCVGAALARSEIQESVHAVLGRLPNLRLDPDAPAPVHDGFALRSYIMLRVKFDVPHTTSV